MSTNCLRSLCMRLTNKKRIRILSNISKENLRKAKISKVYREAILLTSGDIAMNIEWDISPNVISLRESGLIFVTKLCDGRYIKEIGNIISDSSH